MPISKRTNEFSWVTSQSLVTDKTAVARIGRLAMTGRILRCLLPLLLIITPTAFAQTANSRHSAPSPGHTSQAQVTRVVDGDTLKLSTGDTVRLIGVDTPETVHPNKPVEFFGKEASDFTKRIAQGKNVRLEYDWQARDKYNRLLAYVYLSDGTMLNKLIISEGYGHAYTRFPFKYMDEFRRCEEVARAGKKGLWVDAIKNTAPAQIPTGTPASPAAIPSSNAVPGSGQSQTVYRTQTGKKYHLAGCRYLTSSIPTTVAAAKYASLSPCSACNP